MKREERINKMKEQIIGLDDIAEPEKKEPVNMFNELELLPAHTSSVLTIRFNNGKEVLIAAYKYEILPGAIQFIEVDSEAESTYDYNTYVIPLCNIMDIKIENASTYKKNNQ